MNKFRVGVVLVATVAALGLLLPLTEDRMTSLLDLTPLSSVRAGNPAPPLDGAVDWLNSRPLTTADLRGKVVLVDFWTYSCINWQRTLPYVRAWADKYREQGLVVVGVHTPEFRFEKDLPKIRSAVAQLEVHHPVAVDSDYAIWRAFGNDGWPAIYIIDSKGAIRHRQLGEGNYERSERIIQELLLEAGAKDVRSDLVKVHGVGSQAPADWANLRSPETYIGYQRAHNFASPGGVTRDGARNYTTPEKLRLNTWALAGEWSLGAEAATLLSRTGRIAVRFHARDLHLVMGPPSGGPPVPFRVLLDGQSPGAAHGTDVDEDGYGVLVEHRLYQLVRQPETVGDRQLQIEFLAPGVEAFSFTFG